MDIVGDRCLPAKGLIDFLPIDRLRACHVDERQLGDSEADHDHRPEFAFHRTPPPQFCSLIWPLLTTSVTGLPSFTALAAMPSALDLTSFTCE
jgi:hypothetical protein